VTEAPHAVDLTRAETQPALFASLSMAAADEPLPQAALDALRWLTTIWAEGHDDIPLFLVHDLGHLLLRGRDLRFSSSRLLSSWSDEERQIRLAYEDRVLARWATDPAVLEAHVAVAGMPARLRDTAVAHAVSIALGHMLAPLGLPHGNPAHVRPMLESAEVRAAVSSTESLVSKVDELWKSIALGVVARCQPLLAGRRLFTEADLWDIAHLPDVPSESARRALREVHAASALVGPANPGALLVMRRAPEVVLEDDEADTYPTGGFDAVSTKGSFENLVRSEVAYVGAGIHEPHERKEGEKAVDLFDLRFAEGELLYYTRDESPLLEDRRVLALSVDRAAELRHKLPELPAQTLVLVLGVAVRLQADLVQGLGPLGSFMTLALCGGKEDAAVLQEELGLLSLSLRAEIAHRRAQLVAAVDPLEVEARRRVVFSPRVKPKIDVPGLVAWVRVGARTWTASFGKREEAIDAADPAALRALGDEILSMT
jgi:hypothetical protein